MDKTKVKLIVTDVDGTLLNSSHWLNPKFFDVFEQLHSAGITFVVASGRQYQNLREVFEPIEDRVYFAAENGSYVLFQEKEILSRTINPSEIHQLVTIGRTIPSAHLVLCGKKVLILNRPHRNLSSIFLPTLPNFRSLTTYYRSMTKF